MSETFVCLHASKLSSVRKKSLLSHLSLQFLQCLVLATHKRTFYHFTIFPEQLPVYFRFLSSDQQVNLLESRDVTLCKVTSLGQDTSCNRCPDNLLCQRWGVHLVLWFKLLSQFRARLSFWTSKLCQIPWVLNDANLELQEAMVTKVRDVTQSQTGST